MVYIKDLAKYVGVSISTVSRALNDYSDVNEETRKKIKKAAIELGYRPSKNARDLALKRKNNMAVIVSGLGSNNPMDEFTGNILRGIFDYMHTYDITVAMYAISSELQKQQSLEDFCREYGLDGVILVGMKIEDEYVLQAGKSSIPCVAIDVLIEGGKVACVLTDDEKAFREITEYSLSKFLDKIILIKGKEEAQVTHARLKGFKSALKKYNLRYEDVDVIDCRFDEDEAYIKTKDYLDNFKDTRGRLFICMSDLMAIAVVRAIQDSGYRVPEDFSVTGFDGIHLLNYIKPRITTINQNTRRKGYIGMKLLSGLMNGEIQKSIVYIEHQLLEGESEKLL